eukprot:Cvel_17614.t1-p1 / transcript=Cvel_17614.t1 / gene=Cvel_17614 / organism=Chromera_velia_CCMP2878 / gene_product=PHD and RING finger domain-containing protein 1, putative / transcript_product=PHD and RING finger domain-containing protein 1, putative / location=Cvel_scaffold1416:44169-48016(+) / protein_length=1126 / sequence_SO=supercontig / SO=protein_coding / is_pseudo=false
MSLYPHRESGAAPDENAPQNWEPPSNKDPDYSSATHVQPARPPLLRNPTGPGVLLPRQHSHAGGGSATMRNNMNRVALPKNCPLQQPQHRSRSQSSARTAPRGPHPEASPGSSLHHQHGQQPTGDRAPPVPLQHPPPLCTSRQSPVDEQMCSHDRTSGAGEKTGRDHTGVFQSMDRFAMGQEGEGKENRENGDPQASLQGPTMTSQGAGVSLHGRDGRGPRGDGVCPPSCAGAPTRRQSIWRSSMRVRATGLDVRNPDIQRNWIGLGEPSRRGRGGGSQRPFGRPETLALHRPGPRRYNAGGGMVRGERQETARFAFAVGERERGKGKADVNCLSGFAAAASSSSSSSSSSSAQPPVLPPDSHRQIGPLGEAVRDGGIRGHRNSSHLHQTYGRTGRAGTNRVLMERGKEGGEGGHEGGGAPAAAAGAGAAACGSSSASCEVFDMTDWDLDDFSFLPSPAGGGRTNPSSDPQPGGASASAVGSVGRNEVLGRSGGGEGGVSVRTNYSSRPAFSARSRRLGGRGTLVRNLSVRSSASETERMEGSSSSSPSVVEQSPQNRKKRGERASRRLQMPPSSDGMLLNERPRKSLRTSSKPQKGEGEGEEPCPICLADPCDREEDGRPDSCSHVFCFSCITKWAEGATNRCPCCRGQFFLVHRTKRVIDRDPETGEVRKTRLEPQEPHLVGEKVLAPDAFEDNGDDVFDVGSDEGANDIICNICEGGGHEDLLMICDGCGIFNAHTFCLEPPLPAVPRVRPWLCVPCESAEVLTCRFCARGHRSELLMICDSCREIEHTFCARPRPLQRVPHTWLCESCNGAARAGLAGGRRGEREAGRGGRAGGGGDLGRGDGLRERDGAGRGGVRGRGRLRISLSSSSSSSLPPPSPDLAADRGRRGRAGRDGGRGRGRAARGGRAGRRGEGSPSRGFSDDLGGGMDTEEEEDRLLEDFVVSDDHISFDSNASEGESSSSSSSSSSGEDERRQRDRRERERERGRGRPRNAERRREGQPRRRRERNRNAQEGGRRRDQRGGAGPAGRERQRGNMNVNHPRDVAASQPSASSSNVQSSLFARRILPPQQQTEAVREGGVASRPVPPVGHQSFVALDGSDDDDDGLLIISSGPLQGGGGGNGG